MKVGIALGGGGAKGLAHIGVLNALEQAGIRIDIVSGTSIGAIVGALFAGDKLKELEAEALKIRMVDLPRLFSPTFSRAGLFSGKNVTDLLLQHLPVTEIEELPKPFASVSVDLISGETVTATKGELATAIRASMSIPAIFTPIVQNNSLLVDGGILDPVPVAAAKGLGADVVIAIDLFGNRLVRHAEPEIASTESESSPRTFGSVVNRLREMASRIGKDLRKEPRDASSMEDQVERMNLVAVLERVQALTQQQLTRARFSECAPDFIIAPPLGELGFLDFHRANTAIEIGYAAAEEQIPAIVSVLGKR